MNVGLYVGTTESEETMEGLFDADFTENEEYFRSDTLALGFKNEAQRVIREHTNPDGTFNVDSILEVAFGDDNYYKQVQILKTEVKGIQVISIAYGC